MIQFTCLGGRLSLLVWWKTWHMTHDRHWGDHRKKKHRYSPGTHTRKSIKVLEWKGDISVDHRRLLPPLLVLPNDNILCQWPGNPYYHINTNPPSNILLETKEPPETRLFVHSFALRAMCRSLVCTATFTPAGHIPRIAPGILQMSCFLVLNVAIISRRRACFSSVFTVLISISAILDWCVVRVCLLTPGFHCCSCGFVWMLHVIGTHCFV